jgi:hypothetical protein
MKPAIVDRFRVRLYKDGKLIHTHECGFDDVDYKHWKKPDGVPPSDYVVVDNARMFSYPLRMDTGISSREDGLLALRQAEPVDMPDEYPELAEA